MAMLVYIEKQKSCLDCIHLRTTEQDTSPEDAADWQLFEIYCHQNGNFYFNPGEGSVQHLTETLSTAVACKHYTVRLAQNITVRQMQLSYPRHPECEDNW